MNKFFLILLFTLSGQSVCAKQDSLRIQRIETEYKELKHELKQTQMVAKTLNEANNATKERVNSLQEANLQLSQKLDSLQNACTVLEDKQSADRNDMQGKLQDAHSSIDHNQALLESRTLWGIGIVLALIVSLSIVAYWFTKRIKSGSTTIDEIRKAQESLRNAQEKIQEESVNLDNKLLDIAEKQLASAKDITTKAATPDHSLVVKLADEIARIETNLSKMDKSVRGYKQLVQAKDRMINNVRANGYEIISLLGQEYNEGMQFPARFVPDEELPEGKRIITGMIKMQVNYNGQMIQPAEIVVSQNI